MQSVTLTDGFRKQQSKSLTNITSYFQCSSRISTIGQKHSLRNEMHSSYKSILSTLNKRRFSRKKKSYSEIWN